MCLRCILKIWFRARVGFNPYMDVNILNMQNDWYLFTWILPDMVDLILPNERWNVCCNCCKREKDLLSSCKAALNAFYTNYFPTSWLRWLIKITGKKFSDFSVPPPVWCTIVYDTVRRMFWRKSSMTGKSLTLIFIKMSDWEVPSKYMGASGGGGGFVFVIPSWNGSLARKREDSSYVNRLPQDRIVHFGAGKNEHLLFPVKGDADPWRNGLCDNRA